MRKILSFLMMALFSVSMFAADPVEIASGTFDGKNGKYTEGWTTTGTGVGRNDCVIIGLDEDITSPEVDLSAYESITINIKARRYGTLTGSKATIGVTFEGKEIGTTEASGTNATTALTAINYEVKDLAKGKFVFTCTNATSAGSTHGAGINSIVITGVEKSGEGGGSDVKYYMKNNWNVGDWAWKEMTKDGDNWKLDKVVYGGSGVNYNTADNDEGSKWVPQADIKGDQLEAKDTVNLVLDPAAGTVTATIVGKYVNPEGTKYYMKNQWNAGDWAWKEMTKDGDNWKLEKVVYGGVGVNYNTAADDGGAKWVAEADIKGDKLEAKDTVNLVLDPAAGTVTATIVGKYKEEQGGGGEEEDPTAAIKGGWDGWAKEVAFVLADNKLTASGVLNIAAAGDYEFKVILNGSDWRSNGHKYHREYTGAEGITGNGENMILTADVAGEYTFTWTFATNALAITFPAAEEEKVEPKEVSGAIAWDFSKLVANTESPLYNNNGIQLTDATTPSKTDEIVYSEYAGELWTIGEGFDGASIAFTGEYPTRKGKYCQNGTLRFKTSVAGSIIVKFSDTGTSASATAVKRYLVVNGEQTEYWSSRENNGTENPYDAQLDVTTGAIPVAAGEVTIAGSSAIVVYSVEFAPASAPEPVLANGYYLIGQKGWDVAALSADLLFAANPEKEGEFQLSVTLVKDEGVKVVKVENDAIAAWYPEGMGNEYKVDEAHAGEVTIYFRPDKQGGEGWHEGYFYIDASPATAISNTAVEAKAVKMIQGGQLFILLGGKTFTVQGVQVK